MEKLISKATQNNWNKLKTNTKNKLASRANKRLSKKKIIPIEYMDNKENVAKITELLELFEENKWKNEDIIYSLAINLINNNKIENQKNVKKLLSEYSCFNKIDELIDYDIISMKENDVLGLVYQCLMLEGEKNQKGSYYTPKAVTLNMTKDIELSHNQTFIDPCCGSGAYLLSVKTDNPEQIYGVDTDEIAVLIARLNLIIKYKGIEFTPHIYNDNFLKTEHRNKDLDRKFTYIVTNPPWGGMTEKKEIPPEILSGEIFSCFIVRAFESLEENGKMRFLLPVSILNVKTHKDVREYILNNGNLSKITLYSDSFTGVSTKYVDLEIENKKATDDIVVDDCENIHVESKENFKLTNNKVFTVINSQNKAIIKKIQNNGKYYLDNSIWALGIVTGDNKNKLFDKPKKDYEAVYTGKEIKAYSLEKPNKYLKYDRASFQQVAKDEYYRAPEKLVYKFISNKLVFAYDDKKSLFLNSANILIPNIPNMSIKTTMAYLNSDLFSYYYKSLFGEIKILKGNLMEIPFPEISEEENIKITNMVNKIVENGCDEEELQNEIYKTYNLDASDIECIKGEMRKWRS